MARYLKVLERQRLDLLCLRTKPCLGWRCLRFYAFRVSRHHKRQCPRSVNGLLFSQPDMLFNKQPGPWRHRAPPMSCDSEVPQPPNPLPVLWRHAVDPEVQPATRSHLMASKSDAEVSHVLLPLLCRCAP